MTQNQLKSPLLDPNLLSKCTSQCEYCKARFTSIETVCSNILIVSSQNMFQLIVCIPKNLHQTPL